jgi:hypothetical protein
VQHGALFRLTTTHRDRPQLSTARASFVEREMPDPVPRAPHQRAAHHPWVRFSEAHRLKSQGHLHVPDMVLSDPPGTTHLGVGNGPRPTRLEKDPRYVRSHAPQVQLKGVIRESGVDRSPHDLASTSMAGRRRCSGTSHDGAAQIPHARLDRGRRTDRLYRHSPLRSGARITSQCAGTLPFLRGVGRVRTGLP